MVKPGDVLPVRRSITISLTPAHYDTLQSLIAQCGMTDMRELVNNALTAFAWIVQNTASGKKIAAVDEANKKYMELEMGALRNVRPRRH